MSDELTIGGAIVTGGGLVAAVLRWGLKLSISARRDAARADTEAKLEVAKTTERSIAALIEFTRTGAQIMATIDALRTSIADAVEARRRDQAALVAEFKDLEQRIADLTTQVADVIERMARYAEFRDTPIRR